MANISVPNYATIVFDCDGVVLDSNSVKTEAFYQATLPYGEAAAQAMVDYHVANGGVSRYKKFAYFLEQIAPLHAEQQGPDLEALIQAYAGQVREGLLRCKMAPGFEMLRKQNPNARWLIVSGGDQAELRDIFAQRGIADWFDGGIFGSPDPKGVILRERMRVGDLRMPAVFIGDSKYDYETAVAAGMDFIFMSRWTEVRDWRSWTAAKGITVRRCLLDLVG